MSDFKTTYQGVGITYNEPSNEIAEARGFTFIHHNKDSERFAYIVEIKDPNGKTVGSYDGDIPKFKTGRTLARYNEQLTKSLQCLPDYLNSLDLMSETEKSLTTDEQIEAYLEKLTDVCGGDTPVGTASFTAYFATARQRAVAFLAVIGTKEE